MAKLTEPIKTGVLSTRDVRKRVEILIDNINTSGRKLIERQRGYPEPNLEKIAFHIGRIAAATTFKNLLAATPEEWDAIIEEVNETNETD